MSTEKERKIGTEKRVVSLMGYVHNDSANNFIKEILKLELENPNDDIIAVINSRGGSVPDMWAMIDTMNAVRCNVNTLVMGDAMSAGSLLLMSGVKGRRYATEHSTVMIHEMSSWFGGNMSDIRTYTEHLEDYEKTLENYIVKNTKITKKLLKEKLTNDWYLTSKEALELGIVDKIIKSFKDINMRNW